MKVIKAFIHQHRAADVIQALKAASKKQTKTDLVKGIATAEGVAASVVVESKGGAK